jgi:hypothetical protein
MGVPDGLTPPRRPTDAPEPPRRRPTTFPAGAVSFHICPLPPDATDPDRDRALEQATARAWQRLCAANPRLHDAPIWSVEQVTASPEHAGPGEVIGAPELRLSLRPARYRQLATQRQPELIGQAGLRRVRLLGVKGFIVAEDHAARPHVLLARRHPATRVYPGLWEIAPGGGVEPHDPDRPDPAAPDGADLIGTLREELDEELGLAWDTTIAAWRLLGGVDDPQADSFDLIFALRWAGPIDPSAPLPRPAVTPGRASWEVTQTAWAALDEPAALAAFDLTPATRAALELGARVRRRPTGSP